MSEGYWVVKLGGSLVSRDSGSGPWLQTGLVISLARELAGIGSSVVLVHGTGAFGKPPAVRYGYMSGKLARERMAIVAEVSIHLAKYEVKLDEALMSGGLHPFRLPAAAVMRGSPEGCRLADAALVRDLVERGSVTPVIGGGLVPADSGFAVCSSDDIAADLARALGAEGLLFAARVHGVYREFGASERIFDAMGPSDIESVGTTEGSSTDISGGMQAKLRAALRAAEYGTKVHIIDGRLLGNIRATIAGQPVSGTRICSTRPGVD